MQYATDRMLHFPTLSAMRPPSIAKVLAWMLLIGIVICSAILALVPWVQTASGKGQVVALDPDDRQQQVTAFVPGRVERWYVHDGQHVSKGDPIARVGDLDPDLLTRLASERAQAQAEIAALQQSRAVASIDVERSRQLLAEGLAGRRDFELTQIKVAEADAKLAESRAKLTRIDIQLNRQSAQLVRAPRDGRVQQLNAASGSAMVSPGTVLAVIAPERVERAVELYIDGRDVPLIRPGRPVRLEFEGWPAIQFSGWPSVAHGMFDGRVRAIDPNAAPDGVFRILVEPAPGKPAWPAQEFARQGGKVRGWVQGETVKVGYELWRQLNNFPLEFGQRPAAGMQQDGKAKPAAGKTEEDATGKK
ncbi:MULTISPECIES: efflux RND transporter periplasmic adaptor subunit [Xanthomonas]|uniref:HlyD family efflux transporter periplasmic adaptor subunit n=1 Tax=Xanthomonas cucurbitae TaxID=56453 RepID=A0ABY7YG75_9XANT|nr:HlyD family efflux transporter periplasmic adaptor subunit [Xanthomonas cucurbitae]QHG86683.1 HlyD family efflux transporter periplasmic adaptor subunit [Xanthomonas cucurbitae]WDM69016.1 HlyD family efflux transporter periplasmic adaptor subunit [Xanthomonas cucurbitae]WDM72888.1 HlyD family efflux transporter periplasmic adaptor subunit [Xanthomonas cucurbitae]WDM76597.1 HlyD family efflux transporter periplasmic adaptor subunit [Xanthomonas cucurbitae]